jgi:phosphoglycerate dehydrogenase-like enzyme
MRIAVSGRIARQPILAALAALPDVEVVEAAAPALPGHVDDCDALVLSDPRGDEGGDLTEALRHPDARTRWLQVVSAGCSGLLSHPLPAGLVVTNQGGAAAAAVAEHAIALILAHNRCLPAALLARADARWEREAVRPGLRTLEAATIVIVGLGHVGRALAMRLAPFQATTIGINRTGTPCPDVRMTLPMARLNEALASADTIVLCLPATPETYRLIDARRLAMLKPGALVVNVGRGDLIDMAALAQALAHGHLGGAALDVTDPEPLPPDHELWRAPNLIVTPHIAGGGSPLTGMRIAGLVAENAGRFLRGQPLLAQVYPKVAA